MSKGLDSVQHVVRQAYPTAMHACRRDELSRLLKYNGITMAGYMTKDAMLPMALELQESGNMKVPGDEWRPDAEEATLVKAADEPLEVPVEAPVEPVETPPEEKPEPRDKPMSEMHVATLRAICRERGIPCEKTNTREELLEKLDGGNTP